MLLCNDNPVEYHKIETLFERDAKFIVDPSKLKKPVLGTISVWDVTEKIDGTNIRVLLSADGSVKFGGRTDAAQMHAGLLQKLIETFTPEKMRTVFWIDGQPVSAILYGEGYGAGIQKGGDYRPDTNFRLFDVLVNEKWWLDWPAVCDVAAKLGIKTVPYLGRWTLQEIVDRVRLGIPSQVTVEESATINTFISEGIVARPVEPLFDRKGARIILKLKTKDFGKVAAAR